MDFKYIIGILCISLLLFGAVSAQKTVNDFQVDGSFNHVYNGTHNSVYLNGNQDSGVTIYTFAGNEDNDAYENLIHDDGNEYLTPDDDMGIVKNADNTVSFTDYDHAEHGVAEVINSDGVQYIVVFWAKDTSNVNDTDLVSQLNDFNKDNNVSPISF